MTYPYVVPPTSKIVPADVIVFRKGNLAVAIKGDTKQVIASSTDHASFWNELIDALISDNYSSVKIVGSGVFDITDDVVMQKNGLTLVVEGIAPPRMTAEWGYVSPNNLKFVLSNDARLLDDGENWGRIVFKNIIISVKGTYTKTPLHFPKTMLYMDDVQLNANHTADFSGVQLLKGGSAGPPGIPVYWQNVKVLDSRKAGTYQWMPLFIVWYEGFIWDGGNIVISLSDDIGRLCFFRLSGNVWGVFRNIDMFLASIGTNKYQTFWDVYPPSRFENVEFLDDKYIVYYHISSPYNIHVYLDMCRYNEAGSIMIPIINKDKITPIFGPTYKRSGCSTISGNGSTTDFLIGEHGLTPSVVDPTKVIVRVTPASADAIAASPCVGYLSDENGDGIYESIRVKFASAPASGTDNVKVVWEVEYIG